MNGYFANAGSFLVSVIFGFYILMVMLRLLLQIARADFYNPISQFIVKLTNPPLRFLRRFIPGVAGIDMSSILLLLVLQFVELTLKYMLAGVAPHPGLLLALSITHLLSTLLWIYIIAIIIIAIASWIHPGGYHPVLSLLNQLTAPIVRPVARRMPPVSGLDLSPMIVLIILNLILMAIPYLQGALIRLFA